MQERHFKEAFSALSEAVKFKRESWQTWSNYAHAAVQTQSYLQAARGILQVTQLPHAGFLLAHIVRTMHELLMDSMGKGLLLCFVNLLQVWQDPRHAAQSAELVACMVWRQIHAY